MKNITKILIALFAIVAFSCTQDDVENRPVITPTDAPVLTAPTAGTIYELTPENAASNAERFTWTSANFDGNVEITYSVQMDVKGGDFSTPQVLGSVVSENQVAVTVETMNGAALKLGALPFEAKEFDIRVIATTGASTSIVSKEVTPIVIKPYTTESPKLWVPGSYQDTSGYGGEWNPASAPQLAASGYGKTDFEGYIYINDATAQFKLTPAANWDNEFGEAGDTDGVFTGVLKAKPAKNCGIPTATAGYYKIKADTDPAKMTYSATKLVWGIVGDATPGGWDNDTPMVYNPDTKTFTLTVVLTTQAAPDHGMKFRANNNWDYNFGDNEADGILEDGGKNIGTTAGTYLITLDLSTPRHYTYSMVKQ